MIKELRFDTDVLVVGGGGAALFAAIKAKEAGAHVILVDKGGAGYSGQSPYADGYLSRVEGLDLETCADYNFFRGEFMANRDYVKQTFAKCDELFEEMISWGAQAFKEEDGSYHMVMTQPSPGYNLKGIGMPAVLRKQALKIGVKIIDRVMIAHLLKKDNRVVGAAGMSVEDMDFYEFHAKAVILCTGAATLKPNGWPAHNLTGDGDAMAYRAGASIMGKEFSDAHTGAGDYAHYLNVHVKYNTAKKCPPVPADPRAAPAVPTYPPKGARDAEGTPIVDIGTLSLNSIYAHHEGKGPVMMPPRGSTDPNAPLTYDVGGVSAGMAVHKAEGIVPQGICGDTEILGLFAAGDAMATMQSGVVYSPGGALAGSCVTGAVAGVRAVEYMQEVSDIEADDGAVEAAKAFIYEPLHRAGGFKPQWVIQQLRNMMIPYFVTYIKKADRMEAILTMLAFYRDHMGVMLKANDGHELRLAHEARNMILNSEMKLRMALARKESRGMHYREDYPFRDDENFLCWITVKQGEDGAMEMGKIDIPKEWFPADFDTLTYEERYPIRILNEKIPGKEA